MTTMEKGRGPLFKKDGFLFMVFATNQANFWPGIWPQVEKGIYAEGLVSLQELLSYFKQLSS